MYHRVERNLFMRNFAWSAFRRVSAEMIVSLEERDMPLALSL
jgi:hypothetical protein